MSALVWWKLFQNISTSVRMHNLPSLPLKTFQFVSQNLWSYLPAVLDPKILPFVLKSLLFFCPQRLFSACNQSSFIKILSGAGSCWFYINMRIYLSLFLQLSKSTTDSSILLFSRCSSSRSTKTAGLTNQSHKRSNNLSETLVATRQLKLDLAGVGLEVRNWERMTVKCLEGGNF